MTWRNGQFVTFAIPASGGMSLTFSGTFTVSSDYTAGTPNWFPAG
jgi:hypothetical protein